METGERYQLEPPSKPVLQFTLCPTEVQQRAFRPGLHQYVHVAIGMILSTRDRAE